MTWGNEPAAAHESLLRPLLNYLGQSKPPVDASWQGWQIERTAGGWCNLLYRVRGHGLDLAVKFTIRDARDRAGREYAALHALRQAGLSIAPEPLLLDQTSYPQPVVVQTWIEGLVSQDPPETNDEWEDLVQHLALVHSVTPRTTDIDLPRGVRSPLTIEQARAAVHEQVDHVPGHARPESLDVLLRRFERTRYPSLPPAEMSLCRIDSNTLNFIRNPGSWSSVDWENAGWSDPTFDVADLTTHASYLAVPPERWDWVIERYCQLANKGQETAERIQVHRQILIVWWAARIARYLYEIPRGLDPRLAEWPAGWEEDLGKKYARYVRLAEDS